MAGVQLKDIVFPVYIIDKYGNDPIWDGHRLLIKGFFNYKLVDIKKEEVSFSRRRLMLEDYTHNTSEGHPVGILKLGKGLMSYVELLKNAKPTYTYIDYTGRVFKLPAKTHFPKMKVEAITALEADENFTYVWVLGTPYPYRTQLRKEGSAYVNLMEYATGVFLVFELLTKKEYDSGEYIKRIKI